MKYLAFIFLTGCASLTWEKENSDGSKERLTVNTMFRSYEGVEVERDKFKLKVNKAKGEVSPEELAEAIRTIKPF